MKDCNGCRWAEWKRTDSGRLHPSGDGRCTKTIVIPPIPACMYWLNGVPKPTGGYINRRESLKDHCPYWAREED